MNKQLDQRWLRTRGLFIVRPADEWLSWQLDKYNGKTIYIINRRGERFALVIKLPGPILAPSSMVGSASREHKSRKK